jgi:two-component sensor histidine kinase
MLYATAEPRATPRPSSATGTSRRQPLPVTRPSMPEPPTRPGGSEAVTPVGALFPDLPGHDAIVMAAWLDDRCRDLEQTYGRPGGPSLGCSAAAYRLPIGQAITLGLIVDLLVCDAYVHGFPPSEGGRIAVASIGLEAVIEITIDDSGRVDNKATRGRALGLARARLLARELGGWLETPRVVGGSRCIVTVPRQGNRRPG